MRLVDGEPPHPRSPQPRQEAFAGEPLGRNEEEPELAILEPPPELPAVAGIVGGVEARGGDAERLELPHLVAHQRNQRRDDDGQPAVDDRRQLVADRLAAAGRHDGEDVLAGQDPGDDLALAGPERVVAEDRFGTARAFASLSVTCIRACRLASPGRHRHRRACHHGAGAAIDEVQRRGLAKSRRTRDASTM